MKIYTKNKITGEIQVFEADSYFQLSKNIRDENELATDVEATAFELEQAKTLKLTSIVPARNKFMYSDIVYNGSSFINTLTSGNNLTSALAIMGSSINWLDVTGQAVLLTKAQMKELGSLILAKRSSGYFQEITLINEVNACINLAQVEAVNINFE